MMKDGLMERIPMQRPIRGLVSRVMVSMLACALVAVVMPVSAARAQQAASVEPERLLADQLVLQARLSVEGRPNPSPALLDRAKIMLELATQVYPDDPETWLLRRDLALAMEDDVSALEALERYLTLAPEDDAARLEHIIGRAQRDGQTVQEQIKLLGAVLDGSEAGEMTAALRSRLASHIAELAWDSGDMTTFASRLREALRLDNETNVQAAGLLWRLAIGREGTRPDQAGRALMGVVRADPLNPEWRRELAQLLIRQAAYPVAAQQFNAAGRLATRRLDDEMMHDWLISLSAVGATDASLGLLRNYEEFLVAKRQQTERLREAGDPRFQGSTGSASPPQAGTGDMTDVATPADEAGTEEGTDAQGAQVVTESQLPVRLEVFRLAIYDQTRDRILADESFGWLKRKISEQMEESPDESMEMLAWLSLLFNRNLEQATALTQQLELRSGGRPSVMVRRLRAWLDMRMDRTDAARAAFESQLRVDPYAGLGLAKLMPSSPARAALLERVVHQDPASLSALLAAFEIRNQGAALSAMPAGEALTEAMARWPSEIESPDLEAKRWTRLRVRTSKRQYQYLDPVMATITLENSAGLPLGLSRSGPLPIELRLFLNPRQGGHSMGTMPATVIRLDRRLRLGRKEELEIEVDLTATRLGQFLFGVPNAPLSFDVRAVLGPTYDPQRGVLIASPVGDEMVIRAVQRQPIPVNEQAITVWLNALDEPNREMLFRALGQLPQLAGVLLSQEGKDEAVQLGLKITQALEEKYPQLDPPAQAWTIAFIRKAGEGQVTMPIILDTARRSDVPLVRITYLLSQVHDEPDSPDLTAAMRHDNPTIRAFANAHRAVIVQELAAEAAAATP